MNHGVHQQCEQRHRGRACGVDEWFVFMPPRLLLVVICHCTNARPGHRTQRSCAALLYSFATLLLAVFVEFSVWPTWLNLTAAMSRASSRSSSRVFRCRAWPMPAEGTGRS